MSQENAPTQDEMPEQNTSAETSLEAQKLNYEKPDLSKFTKAQLLEYVTSLYHTLESQDAEIVDGQNTITALQRRLVEFNQQFVVSKKELRAQIDSAVADLGRMGNLSNYNDSRANVLTDANDILVHALRMYEGETSWDGTTFLCSEDPRNFATYALNHFSVRAAQS
jgi:small-conductance mechanosensitive channel